MATALRGEVKELAHRMRLVARRHRAAHPLSPPTWEAGSYPVATYAAGRPDTKTLVWFPSPGCFWSLKGGCTMCDFGSNLDVGSTDDAVHAFEQLIDRLDSGTRRVHVAPGGSFFSDSEAPPALRRGVIRALEKLPFLRGVGIETRPPLLTLPRLMDVIEWLPAGVSDLTIGFGFECVDDLVREVTVNKGYGPDDMKRASRVIDSVNEAQARVRVNFEVYVLLKPLFLAEQEGIDEALRTIDWAYAQGAETTTLFLNTVKPQTIQGYLASLTDLAPPVRYRPPYCRSAVEVLRALPAEQRRRTKVLGVQSGILAEGMPRGCPLCTPFLLGALMAHNFTEDPRVLDEAAASWCPCKDSWREELSMPHETLVDRVRTGLDVLERAFPA